MGKRGGGVLLYIKETIPAYEVQLQEEADCKEALWCNLVTGHTTITIGVVYGQGSQKLYNWQNIVSPPHYRNDVHHPHDIICLNCRGLQDESEYIYFYIDYVSHLSSIDEYCRTFGSNTVILACLQTNIAHSNLLHKKSINCNQTI